MKRKKERNEWKYKEKVQEAGNEGRTREKGLKKKKRNMEINQRTSWKAENKRKK